MPIKKYQVDTDKGSFEVEVEEADAPPPAGTTGAEMLSGKVGRETNLSDAPSTESEPGTFLGGFFKSLGDQARELGSSMFESAAHPQTAGDMLGLLLPTTGPGVLKGLNEFEDRSKQALKAAGRETPGTIRGLMSYPGRAAAKFHDALPSSNEAAVSKFMGERAVAPKSKPPIVSRGKPDAVDSMLHPEVEVEVDRYKPNESGYEGTGEVSTNRTPYNVPEAPRQGQTMTEVADEALQEMLGESSGPRQTTMAPEATTAGEGATKQSGKFGKSGNLGQAGGYSSGRPSITDRQYEDLLERKGMEPPPEPEVGGGEAGLGSGATELADESAPAVSTRTPLTVEELAQKMREMYGSRDAGRMIYGDSLPPAERGAAVKRLAPGPSRTPLTAEQRIEEAERASKMGEPEPVDNVFLQQLLDSLKKRQ